MKISDFDMLYPNLQKKQFGKTVDFEKLCKKSKINTFRIS